MTRRVKLRQWPQTYRRSLNLKTRWRWLAVTSKASTVTSKPTSDLKPTAEMALACCGKTRVLEDLPTDVSFQGGTSAHGIQNHKEYHLAFGGPYKKDTQLVTQLPTGRVLYDVNRRWNEINGG